MMTAAPKVTTKSSLVPPKFALTPNMINLWSNLLQAAIQHDWLPKQMKHKYLLKADQISSGFI